MRQAENLLGVVQCFDGFPPLELYETLVQSRLALLKLRFWAGSSISYAKPKFLKLFPSFYLFRNILPSSPYPAQLSSSLSSRSLVIRLLVPLYITSYLL